MPKPIDDTKPRRVRRGPSFKCDEEFAYCKRAHCDACTAKLYRVLMPQILRCLKTGNWYTFTLIWTINRYSDDQLRNVRLAHVIRAIRKKLQSRGLNGIPMIASIDIDLEIIDVGTGARYWQIHVHGLIDVGPHLGTIAKKLRAEFPPGPPLDINADVELPTLRPVVFKKVTDPVNWVSYIIKEPSRIVDKRVTGYAGSFYDAPKFKPDTNVGKKNLGEFIADYRNSRPRAFSNSANVLKRRRRLMTEDELQVLHDFLSRYRVRDRLILQGFKLYRNGNLKRFTAAPHGRLLSNKRVADVSTPIINVNSTTSSKPLKTVRTRNYTPKR